MILVMGATGHIGSKVVQLLLKEKHPVRCFARHFPNADAFPGAEIVIGDANEVADLADAMRGCSAALIMLPQNKDAENLRLYQNKLGEVIAEAIEESGINKIVNISSIGADLQSGTGPILGLHDQEERLNQTTHADIVHLRCAYFMENLINGIPSIIQMNRYFDTISPDASIPMTATRDIAARAAFLLLNPDFDGKNVEYILGERNLTGHEAMKAIAKAIGKDEVEYVEISDDEMRKHLLGMQMSESVVDSLIELNHCAENGTLTSTVSRDRVNTTNTSIEEFARTTFLEAYNKELEKERARRGRDSSAAEARP
jgi:Predicted nucleoside-diphosphate-sugar epimerases